MNLAVRIRSSIPKSIRIFFRNFLGLSSVEQRFNTIIEDARTSLEYRVTSLENRVRILYELHEKPISQIRWSSAKPTNDLTWGRQISGNAFIGKAAEHIGFSTEKSILEIGPGYGRLLRACLEMSIPFSNYYAVELSPINCSYLVTAFNLPNVHIINADAESVDLQCRADIVLSSLTFKHLSPTFEGVLANISRQIPPSAIIAFDLIEGAGQHFEADGVTFIHIYSKDEVMAILERVGLSLVAFDTVRHDADHVRMLVVAAKG